MWEVRLHDTKWKQDWREIYAVDAEGAATRYCELSDRDGDYSVVTTKEIEMRRRELLRRLAEINDRPWKAPLFPSRTDARRLVAEEDAWAQELVALLPEIIDKLSSPVQ